MARDHRDGLTSRRWRRRIGAGAGIAIVIVAAIAIGGNTDLGAPPRFDGAGYAVLAEALATGQGYREIDHPDRPRHAHYPPGYPTALALLWRVSGRSVASAHALSCLCTLAAILLAWRWFRALHDPRTAWLLGLALATNWTWGRNGGAIRSEPLYLLVEMLAVRAASWAGRGVGVRRGAVLGLLLGCCVLTRHVGTCLALAIGLDLCCRGRRASAAAAGLVATALVLPWAGWLRAVGHGTQAELLAQGGLADRVARQSLFYLQRIPDQIIGPVVEIGTVFRPGRVLSTLVNLWAALATALICWGWLRTLRTQRRRLAGLVPLVSLPLLLAWPFTEAGRFLIPLVPFLLVGAVEALAVIAARLRLRRPRAWAAGAVLAASLPYSVYALATDRAGAQRQTYRDFDAACAWIKRPGTTPGRVLTRHPGEVYWLTGRQALAPSEDDPDATDRAIDRYGVAYLLIDEERYARAPTSPLLRYVASHPGRVRRVWQRESGGSSVAVFAVATRRGAIEPAGPG